LSLVARALGAHVDSFSIRLAAFGITIESRSVFPGVISFAVGFAFDKITDVRIGSFCLSFPVRELNRTAGKASTFRMARRDR